MHLVRNSTNFIVSNLPCSCLSHREDSVNVDECKHKDISKIEQKVVRFKVNKEEDDIIGNMNCTELKQCISGAKSVLI